MSKTQRNQRPHHRRTFLRLIGFTLIASLFASTSPTVSAQTLATEKLKIGIIGSGRVGSALGKAWLNAGHQVMFSSQHLEDDKAFVATLGSNALAGTPTDAAQYGDVLLVAVPYSALPSLGRELGNIIKDKIIIDACNPIVTRDGEMAAAARDKGAGLASSEFLPNTRIVRTFNAIPAAKMAEAASKQANFGMPMASDDASAIQIVSRLVRDAGYEPTLIGKLAMGKYLLPGTPLAGEHSAEELRKIAGELK